jgi:Uma2 family endonuclease
MVAPRKQGGMATFADLSRAADPDRVEVVGGEVVERAAPGAEHGDTQGALTELLRSKFHRGGGSGGAPGGWWILVETTIELAPHEVYTPDLSGWRRDRQPTRPSGYPIRTRPDWVCEVLSPGNASQDRATKLVTYHQARIPHYWIVDPIEEVLTVHRWQEGGYLVVTSATRDQTVRAEPFDAIELQVGVLFGDEPLPEP